MPKSFGRFQHFRKAECGSKSIPVCKKISGIENYKRSFDFVFKPDTTESNARVTFAMLLPDTTVSVDNVYLYRVGVERIDSTLKNRLFYNPASSVQVYSLEGISY
ncbi:MAG: hypothetical protein IPG02_16380 [Ignavibacteria bacterium]|nr:hypothetical protein [Ignavibacteria bacterium]